MAESNKSDLPALEDIPDKFEPDLLFEAFNRHKVDYIVIGGLAAVVHGAEVNTRDLDLVVEQSRANLDRVAGALRELGARRITNASLHDLAGEPPPANSYEIVDRIEMFRTSAGRVDIMREALVIGGYQDIGPRSQAYLIRGQEVFVADLDTVIRAKEASARPKDIGHLEALYDLRAVLAGQQVTPLDAANASIKRAGEMMDAIERDRTDSGPPALNQNPEMSHEVEHDR